MKFTIRKNHPIQPRKVAVQDEIKATLAAMTPGVDSVQVNKAGLNGFYRVAKTLGIKLTSTIEGEKLYGVMIVAPAPVEAVETVPTVSEIELHTTDGHKKRGRPTREKAAAKALVKAAQQTDEAERNWNGLTEAEEAELDALENSDDDDDEAPDPNGMTAEERQKFFTTLREKFDLGIINQEEYDSRKALFHETGMAMID